MAIYTNSTGSAMFTDEDVPVFAMLALKHAIRLYAKTGMKANRAYTPTNMRRTAEKWTGEKFGRSDWGAMEEALRVKIEEARG